MTLDFERQKLVRELKRRKPKKILVQLAEGIKQNAFDIKGSIEDLGIEVVFSGETCWGGCCIGVHEAQITGADLIVHFGHAEFIKVDYPVLYMEVKDILDLGPLLKKSFKDRKKFKTLGLSYSIQHRHDLAKIKKFYRDNGKKIILSKKKGKVAYEGHIVGCQYEGLKAIEDKVDAFVIVGNNFHSMGAAIAVDKPVILLDVYNNEVREMKGVRDKTLKERAISIGKLIDARKVGIITEIKLGQVFGETEYLSKKLKNQDKQVIIINMNEVTPDKIMNFYDVDAFVEIACPRIAIDDFAKYEKPILTYKEALVAVGEKTWEDLLEKGFV